MVRTPLTGIIPPMVTPLTGPDALDVAGLERLLEHLITGGVHGLFLLGTTGEGPSLSYRLRRELIDRTCRVVRKRVPVLVGITDTAASEALAVARHAADAGADVAVMAPPFYFPMGQSELLDYTQRMASALPLPLMLYNMPANTKVAFEPQTVRRLVDHPRIIGMKDSSGDLGYFDEILAIARERPDWTELIGPEDLLGEAVARGGQGGVNGGANLHPRLYVKLYEALVRREQATVAELQRQVCKVQEIYKIGMGGSAIAKGLKCALSLLGVCNDAMAEPFERFAPPERERVRMLLSGLGLSD